MLTYLGMLMAVNILTAVAVVLFISPLVMVGVVPLAFAYLSVQRRYTAVNREVQRLDSVAFSPILSHLGESLQARYQTRL